MNIMISWETDVLCISHKSCFYYMITMYKNNLAQEWLLCILFQLLVTVSICAWFLKCQFGSLLQTQKKTNNQSSLNLIFAGYTGSKNQVRTRPKIKFVSKSIFFRVWNWKKFEWHSIFQKSSGDRQGVSLTVLYKFGHTTV